MGDGKTMKDERDRERYYKMEEGNKKTNREIMGDGKTMKKERKERKREIVQNRGEKQKYKQRNNG